jgi:tetratricopeptide (TPR) repeat protein
MKRDRFDLPLTTSSDAAAFAYNEGLDRLLSAWTGAEEAMDRAIAADPDFALAHIARARLHQIFGRAAEARACAARAIALANHATDRERGHLNIIACSIEGQPAKALAGAERHLDEYPRDALILSLLLGAFGLYAFSGRPDHDQARLTIYERHAQHYGQDWWFLSYLGWSNTEAGNVGIGRELTEHALALRSQNGNAAHAMAHALFEQGDAAAGGRFLSGWIQAHNHGSFLNGHLSWHLALIAIESGDCDGALAIYDNHIRPAVSNAPPINVFTDSVSLLWRVALDGHSIPRQRWDEVSDFADRRVANAGSHFMDLHYVLAAAATGDRTRLERRFVRARTAPCRRQACTGSRRGRALPGRRCLCFRRQQHCNPHSGGADGRGGPHRRKPRPARAMGGHADRRLPA